MKKQVLREWISLDYTPEMVLESKNKNGGKILMPAILQKAGMKNQNGRIYPMEILQREVNNYSRTVGEGRALGELDHPESSTVALERVSHVIREISWDGDTVRGVVEVLNTPMGKILQSLLESGVKIGMSSRGIGSTEKNEGADEVQEDYKLICFDAVSEPSTPGAFINESLDESKIFSKDDRIYRLMNDIVRK